MHLKPRCGLSSVRRMLLLFLERVPVQSAYDIALSGISSYRNGRDAIYKAGKKRQHGFSHLRCFSVPNCLFTDDGKPVRVTLVGP